MRDLLPWDMVHAARLTRGRGMPDDTGQFWLELQSRAWFARRYLTDRNGKPWRVRPYQVPSLESRAARKVHCSGRDVGKTAEIEVICAWASICLPMRQMLIATQHESNLTPLMRRLQTLFERNEYLASNVLRIRQSPSWHLEFRNGFQIYARIAGPGGVNFQGMHVDWQLVDEAQNLTDDAWNQLYPALNAGGARWVYGVPNGMRNQFYRLSRHPAYEQYHWPSAYNPGFDDDKDREFQYLYGGKDAPGYVHNVLGLHGSPDRSVFQLNRYLACVGTHVHFDVSVRSAAELPDLRDPELPEAIGTGAPEFYLGCDLGFAQDPSELVVYATRGGPLYNLGRIHMENVDYATQQQVIEKLDADLDFAAIGIDSGHSGCAVAHNLMAIGPRWPRKIVQVPFGGAVSWDASGEGAYVKRFVKELATEILIRLMSSGEIVFPPIADRMNQYAGHTYCIAPSGRMVFSKGNDHIIDADRCAIMAVKRDLLEHETPPPVLAPRVAFFG